MNDDRLRPDEYTPVYVISVAAQIAGMHPQTLRQYDRLGLVQPGRTIGQSRRYSFRDVEKLLEVQRLSNEGLSLEGIRRVLDLEDAVVALKARVRELEAALADAVLAQPGKRVFAAGAEGEVETLRAGTRVRRRTDVVIWRPQR